MLADFYIPKVSNYTIEKKGVKCSTEVPSLIKNGVKNKNQKSSRLFTRVVKGGYL